MVFLYYIRALFARCQQNLFFKRAIIVGRVIKIQRKKKGRFKAFYRLEPVSRLKSVRKPTYILYATLIENYFSHRFETVVGKLNFSKNDPCTLPHPLRYYAKSNLTQSVFNEKNAFLTRY